MHWRIHGTNNVLESKCPNVQSSLVSHIGWFNTNWTRESVCLKWLCNIKFLSNVLIPLSMNIHDMRPTIVVYTLVCWALGWTCVYNLECISFLRTKDTHISFLFLFTFIDSHHLCTIRGEKSIFFLTLWTVGHLIVIWWLYSFCLAFYIPNNEYSSM